MSWFSDSNTAKTYRKLGPVKFFGIMFGILAWVVIGTWLSISLDWPDAYGFHCSGRGCMFEDLWYSPRLIEAGHHSLMEIGLFVWEWTLPAIFLGFLVWALVRILRKKRFKLTIFEPKDSPE